MSDPGGDIWDCVVVGAGVVGSWTAYHLTQAGYNTLMIDQVSNISQIFILFTRSRLPLPNLAA